jgi:tetracycline repressor-like protein
MLQAAIDAGRLAFQPTRPLAQVLIGALDEAAMYVATAEDGTSAHGAESRACCTRFPTA